MNKLTPLSEDHLKLADKVKNWNPYSRAECDIVAIFLNEQFANEDKHFDQNAWLIACGYEYE